MHYKVLPWEFDQLPKWVRRDIMNRFRIKAQEQADSQQREQLHSRNQAAMSRLKRRGR